MRITLTICAAAIALCGLLNAQSAITVDQVKVHFSTPVEAGGATVAAGDCSIQVVRGATDNLMLELTPETGPGVLVVVNRFDKPANYTEGRGTTQVILSKHDGIYRFERILLPDHSGFEAIGSVE
jgi:hypothetical protein